MFTLVRRDPKIEQGLIWSKTQPKSQQPTSHSRHNQAFTLGLGLNDNKSMPTVETLASWGTYDPNGESSIAFVLTPFGELAIQW